MRKGFTLVELIFVIVIIGILAAAAIPQFTNLKQSAEASNVIKTTIDAVSSATSVAVNLIDLEDTDPSTIELSDLVQINGKGWSYTGGAGAGTYQMVDSITTTNVISNIELNATGRSVAYLIDCAQFTDDLSNEKCTRLLDATVAAGTQNGTTGTITLSF